MLQPKEGEPSTRGPLLLHLFPGGVAALAAAPAAAAAAAAAAGAAAADAASPAASILPAACK